jgi:hypothetical protein
MTNSVLKTPATAPRRSATGTGLALLACGATALLAGCGSSGDRGGKTLGFAVVGWRTMVYETPYMDECPDGLAQGNDELWWKGVPPEERAILTKDGTIEPVTGTRRAMSVLRGPKGEDVCWHPTSVKDPPLRVVEGDTSYGLDLDGDATGKGTPMSCPHVNFKSPDGKPGVDNQLYRILGCTYGWRRHGYIEDNANGERRDTSHGIVLIEVSGVDDPVNDDQVEVAFFKKADGDSLPKDHRADVLAHATYRADPTPRYGGKTQGKIVDGVLETDPMDVTLPFYGNLTHLPLVMKGMRMQLPVNKPERFVEGMVAGYQDLDNFWDYIQRYEYLLVTGQFSCPGIYVAMKELADGYPDPKTGECTALSAAFTIRTVPAFISHEGVEPSGVVKPAVARVAAAGGEVTR